MQTRSRVITASLAFAAAGLVMAGCGSSSKTSTSGGATTTVASSAYGSSGAPTTAAGQAAVKTKTDPKLGVILADSSGKTVYTLTDANGQAVACTGNCPANWPPLMLPAGQTAATGQSGTVVLGVTAAGGGQQVTANGLPFYRFVKAPDEGDA